MWLCRYLNKFLEYNTIITTTGGWHFSENLFIKSGAEQVKKKIESELIMKLLVS